ncbi:MAG: hypothetical protein ACYC7I_08580 [Gammaproteobacteria bacterium]
MTIVEQVECVADAENNAARRCRVKWCAAGCGFIILLLVVLLGPLLGAHDTADNAVATAQPFAGDAHE